jgi:hypothetical protein
MPNPANIHAALVAAQAELTNPPKKSKADLGNFGFKYADLPSVIDHVRPVLARHGLAVTQDIALAEGRIGVTTTLHHSSGETLTFGPLAGPAGAKWTDIGGGITYARRYALCAALNIAGDDDLDTQVVDATAPAKSKPKAVPPKPVATDEDILRWYAGLTEADTFIALKRVADEIAAHHIDDEGSVNELRALFAARQKEFA